MDNGSSESIDTHPRPSSNSERSRRFFRALGAFFRPCVEFVPIFVTLLFLGALFWAKDQDSLSRHWFSIRAAGHKLNCVAILPKPVQKRPVIIYAHGSGGSLMNDGFVLRQMAELGLAVVSLDYHQTNATMFPAEMEAVQNHLAHQNWADTNAIAWVGMSLGANRMMDLVQRHPERQPQLLVQLSGAGWNPSSNLHCPVLFIHSDQDEVFPLADTERLAFELRTNGVPVQLKILHGLSHGLGPERGVIFRFVGEYCRMQLWKNREQKAESRQSLVASAAGSNGDGSEMEQTDNKVWLNYHSLAQFEADAPPFWPFCLPAAAWMVGYYAWRHRRNPVPVKKIKLRRHEVALRWLAAVLGIWAVGVTALHLVPPHLSVSKDTLAIARRCLIQPKERADFDFLASQPIWQGQKLKTLMDQAELANYNRELINWKLDETIYHNYVLSPIIEPSSIFHPPSSSLNWRRPLWEEFYPRIRHENSPADAAQIVVRHLRERVTIADLPNPPRSVSAIWRRQITDGKGFQIIYVAALRSVGVPARLDTNGQPEFYDGNQWQPAPKPAVD